MTRLLTLCVLGLVLAGGSADPLRRVRPQKSVDKTFLQHQLEISRLFYHIHEPIWQKEHIQIANTWDIEKNIEHYTNVTAVKLFVELYEYGMLPRGVPFTILDDSHRFEATTLFNVLYSAKDYDTFHKTAVWARHHVNELLFVHVLSVVTLHRPDTQGYVIPPLYEIFPSFFNNGEIMTTAQRLNTHGQHFVHDYPHTYMWNNDIVIQANYTHWPYYRSQNTLVAYFTHDHGINTWYHNIFLTYPSWLGGEVVPLVKDRRGELFWFIHKQLLTRYYMERLSNGLPEIEELSLVVPIEEGFSSGLLYHSGIPFPTRQNHLDLKHHPEYVDYVIEIEDYEHRIRDAIDQGYYVNHLGEHISLHTHEGIDILGRLVEANVDSPNRQYYRDFISLWKFVLGNTVSHHSTHHHADLVLPGVLDHYQTALRDPAFYMLWKRIMTLFNKYHTQLPHYKPEELALPSVVINKVEVDKLVTYFEHSYLNVTNHLYLDQHEVETVADTVSVVVQHARLNHKVFQVRVHVKSEMAKTVIVRFFLAPKYDSQGHEIPLHENYENFFQFDEFTSDLKQGDNVITRDSTDNRWTIDDWATGHEVYEKAEAAFQGSGKFMLDTTQILDGYPDRLILPKGRVGGMPFNLFVYISQYKAPKVQVGTGFDPIMSLGLGSGARYITDDPFGFPLDRPLYEWQIHDLHNVHIEEVLIHHKHTSEVHVPHLE